MVPLLQSQKPPKPYLLADALICRLQPDEQSHASPPGLIMKVLSIMKFCALICRGHHVIDSLRHSRNYVDPNIERTGMQPPHLCS